MKRNTTKPGRRQLAEDAKFERLESELIAAERGLCMVRPAEAAVLAAARRQNEAYRLLQANQREDGRSTKEGKAAYEAWLTAMSEVRRLADIAWPEAAAPSLPETG